MNILLLIILVLCSKRLIRFETSIIILNMDLLI